MTTTQGCPVCGAAVAGSTSIVECSACGHRWMWRSETAHRQVDETVYTADYAGYKVDPRFQRSARAAIERLIVPTHPAPAAMLDVGCGAGEFLEGAVSLGYDAQGIDISPASAALCTAKGLSAMSGDYLTQDFGRQFDVITMWDVVEHLREPAAFFARTRELLAPGGLFVGKVPGFGALSVGLARAAPRTAGMLLGAPDHCQYFTPRTLAALAERNGFDVSVEPSRERMRSLTRGGSAKRRTARQVARTVARLSGDSNIFFSARAAA